MLFSCKMSSFDRYIEKLAVCNFGSKEDPIKISLIVYNLFLILVQGMSWLPPDTDDRRNF